MSAPKKSVPATPHSEIISSFLIALEQARKDVGAAEANLEHTNNELCDCQHLLELGDLTYQDRAKVAAELTDVLRRRREAKNTIDVLKPLRDYYIDPRNAALFNALRNILGEMRKIEKNHNERYYTFRTRKGILKDGKIQEGN